MSTNLDPRNVTVGEAAPTEPRTEAQIAADLERQRAELAATIDQLYGHGPFRIPQGVRVADPAGRRRR